MTLGKIKVHQVFNSSLVSGPETLVMPNLSDFTDSIEIVLIQEKRLPEGSKKVANYVRSLGFRCHEVWVKSRLDFSTGRALAELWKREKPDVIHSHGQKASFYTLMGAQWPLYRNHAQLVTTNHSVRLNQFSKKLQRYEVLYQKCVIPYFSRTLTVCSTDASLLRANGVPANKIRVHLNGVDRKKVSPVERDTVQQEVRRRWKNDTGIEFDGVCFGVVARLSPEKRIDRILDSLALARQEVPEIKMRLACMGLGPLEKELRARAETLGVADRVHWLGYRKDAALEMAGFDALLSWSDAEGLPINLVEAGWAGTPVVAHKVDGVNDLVTRDCAYVLEKPMRVEDGARALIEMSKHREMRRELGIRFQNRVESQFAKASWVQRLNEIYREILG